MKHLAAVILGVLLTSHLSAQDGSYSGDTAIQRKCKDAGTLDSIRFIRSNVSLLKGDTVLSYPWEAAENLSHHPEHQPQDPLLILQLLCRSEEGAPIDHLTTIQMAYDAWKADTIFVFNICDHVVGTYGWIWCVGREAETFSQLYDGQIKSLSARLNKTATHQLIVASDASTAFIHMHVAHEEGLGGTGYSGFCIEAAMAEMGDFINLVNDVHLSTHLSDWSASPRADDTLNMVYKKVLADLGDAEPPIEPGTATVAWLRDTEKLWLIYRDATAALFHSLQPRISVAHWRLWLAEHRTEQLRHIGESSDSY